MNYADWFLLSFPALKRPPLKDRGSSGRETQKLPLLLALTISHVHQMWCFFECHPLHILEDACRLVLMQSGSMISIDNYFLPSNDQGNTPGEIDRKITIQDYVDQYGRSIVITDLITHRNRYRGAFLAAKQQLFNLLLDYRPTNIKDASRKVPLTDLATAISIDSQLTGTMLRNFKNDFWIEIQGDIIELFAIPWLSSPTRSEQNPVEPPSPRINFKESFSRPKDATPSSSWTANPVSVQISSPSSTGEDTRPIMAAKTLRGPQIPRSDNEEIAAEETAEEFVEWVKRTGRTTPVDQFPLIQAIFKKIHLYRQDIPQFGLQMLAFRDRLEEVTAFDVAGTIIKSRDPYKKEYKQLEYLPQNLRAIVRRFLVLDFIIEGLLTLNFTRPKNRNSWHSIIFGTLREYLTLTETIRKLGIFYWEKFFALNFFRDTTPLLNYYYDIFMDRLRQAENAAPEQKALELQALARSAVGIWSIYDRYNTIAIRDFQLPTEWIFEELYGTLLPAVLNNPTLATTLEPWMIKQFFDRGVEMERRASPNEVKKIEETRTLLSSRASEIYFDQAMALVEKGDNTVAILRSAWSLVYALISSNVDSLALFLDFYLKLRLTPGQSRLLLIHLAIILRSLRISEEDSEFHAKRRTIESLALITPHQNDIANPAQREEVSQIQRLLIQLTPSQDTKLFQNPKIPHLVKNIVQLAESGYSEPLRGLLGYSNYWFSPQGLTETRQYFSAEQLRRSKFSGSFPGKIAVAANPEILSKEIFNTLLNLGFERFGKEQEKKKGQRLTRITEYRGGRGKFGVQVFYSFNSADEFHTLIEWTLYWLPSLEVPSVQVFAEWLAGIHESAVRDALRKIAIEDLAWQTCGSCKEALPVQGRSDFDLVACSKCRIPNIIRTR
ncbi:MAG TPA: hypothetical protein VJ044_02420 [Candidatus Hodarchaeales archaeon]|nr:hypothetical protein [Candidatus Hodarchaeales archaeon]